MIYGESNVDILKLKEWVNNIEITNRERGIIDKYCNLDKETSIKIINEQIKVIRIVINKMQEDDDWRDILGMCSPLFFDLFFLHENNSIKFANYYECLLIPCDIGTRKSLIQGFDYKEIGKINIYNIDNDIIGNIGEKSDLIWTILYNYFIAKDEFGNISHTVDHENYLTLQLWDIDKYTEDELNQYIDSILLNCSLKLGLNFKKVKLEPQMKEKGNCENYEIYLDKPKYEKVPMMYFNNGFQSEDVRLSFLSYYQVMEYYYVRAQNLKMIDELRVYSFNDDSINHFEFRKVLKEYSKLTREIKSLELVLKKAINISYLKSWINESEDRRDVYLNNIENHDMSIDLNQNDDKIISKLAKRIYFFRCSIAHAKGDIDEFIAIPSLSDELVKRELELMKLISFNVLEHWSDNA